MKKKLIGVAFTLLAAVSLSACGKTKSTPTKDSQPSQTASVTSSESTSSSIAAKTEKKTDDTQRVGSAEYGYIDIPKNWIPFKDLNGGDDIQYTDGTGYNIVTLNALTKEKANIGEGEEWTAETIATRLYYSWDKNPNVDKIWGAKTTVSDHDTFQVNIIMKSGQYLISWVFKDEDKVHLIAFEGEKEVLADIVEDIEHTWSRTKN
ncbi:hypothetical protein [Streptococcus cuniculi]|uniref:Lipoprotein n=1 Tax=Streptococcus cuniculi TaxID=1432788 RepID=A0A4Y9JBU2_9STRE|nr:hypothetical protein [Streptococcus cuniculi]MBF0777829.1 hypothetical protein [Streptococcus cuniculi]TFU98463.1 hypothetical protein E4T82_03720 [Streptococcus cuniculi]